MLSLQAHAVVAARHTHAAATHANDAARQKERQKEQQQEFADPCDSLVAALAQLDRNHSRVVCDCCTPRKLFASATTATSSAFIEYNPIQSRLTLEVIRLKAHQELISLSILSILEVMRAKSDQNLSRLNSVSTLHKE